MHFVSDFLRSESGLAAADTVVILGLMALFFSIAFSFSPGQVGGGSSSGSAHTITVGTGWGLGGGARLPQIGPLHDRR